MVRRAGSVAGVVAVAAGATVLIWSQGRAQAPPAGARYAVVELERILNEYQQTRDVEKILSERARQLQDKLDAHRRAIETRRSELAKLDPDSAEAYKLQQEIVRLQVQAEMLQKIDQPELLRERNLWTSQGYKQAFAAVRQIAQSRGLDLVLFQDRFDPDTPPAAILARMPARKVVYADPRLDITEDVLKLLNQQYQQRGGSASIKIGL